MSSPRPGFPGSAALRRSAGSASSTDGWRSRRTPSPSPDNGPTRNRAPFRRLRRGMEGAMQEQSFTLYADWSRERHRWMIVDEVDFRPRISEESVEKLMEVY